MKRSLLRILRCPRCQSKLEPSILEEDAEIREGELKCYACQTSYPITRYIPRFVSTNLYASNFSFEWNTHRQTWLDSYNGFDYNKKSLLSLLQLRPQDFKGKTFLDAGCGSGRFSEVVKDLGGEVVSIDISFAVEACHINIGRSSNVHVVQGDLKSLPFEEGAFDYVFSIGVLQHLPDPQVAFDSIAKSLRTSRDSVLAVALYSNEGPTGLLSDVYTKGRNITTTIYRVFTTRISNESLYSILRGVLPAVYAAKSLDSGVHNLLDLAIPTSVIANPELRLLDTFDWYSPRYQFYFSRHDVQKLYKHAGLTLSYLAATNNGVWARGHGYHGRESNHRGITLYSQ